MKIASHLSRVLAAALFGLGCHTAALHAQNVMLRLDAPQGIDAQALAADIGTLQITFPNSSYFLDTSLYAANTLDLGSNYYYEGNAYKDKYHKYYSRELALHADSIVVTDTTTCITTDYRKAVECRFYITDSQGHLCPVTNGQLASAYYKLQPGSGTKSGRGYGSYNFGGFILNTLTAPDGRCISTPQPSLNIVKMTDGSVRKVKSIAVRKSAKHKHPTLPQSVTTNGGDASRVIGHFLQLPPTSGIKTKAHRQACNKCCQ